MQLHEQFISQQQSSNIFSLFTAGYFPSKSNKKRRKIKKEEEEI